MSIYRLLESIILIIIYLYSLQIDSQQLTDNFAIQNPNLINRFDGKFKMLQQQEYMEKDIQWLGDSPQARFGHTITPIGKERAILFGGAVGDSGNKYIITSDTYLCDYIHKKFKKLECRGNPPSNRAAHATVCIQNFLFVYGGALGGGQLADQCLYQLDVLTITDKAFWTVKNCVGTSPGPRYGHVMGYLKPFLIIHGGNTGNEPVGDVWVNDITGACQWKKVDTGVQNPPGRVYHSASICRTGTANGMMVIFGGRGADGQPLNDTWGLRKHRDNRLDWMKAPYRNNSVQTRPAERYQHRTLFIGTLLLVIGGRNNQVGESMSLDIYDTDTSEWHKLPKIDRFRHISFLVDTVLYIHGGFDQQLPTVPTHEILKLDLNKMFNGVPALMTGLSIETGRDVINHSPSNSLRRSSGRENHNIIAQQSRRNDYKMDIQHKRHNQSNQSNRSIRLCPEAIVANFKQQNDVKKISIDELQSETKRLGEHGLNSFTKDNAGEVISKYFLSSLFMKSVPELSYPIPLEYLDKLLIRMEKIFSQESTLLRIRPPVKIFGDIHGQPSELNRYFQNFLGPDDDPRGDIESTNYLFLGDYIDRGTKSLETLLMLFSLKLKYPDSFFLIRGSHEDKLINRSLGFGDQCQIKLKENIDDPNSFFQKVNRLFEKMPIAAVVEDAYLCVHGGIGATLSSLQQIGFIDRPIRVNHEPKTRNEKIVHEILWSDPCGQKEPNGCLNIEHDYFKKKNNLKFSDHRLDSFCSQNQLIAVIRSGEPIMTGIESRQSLIGVYSCTNYGDCGNMGSSIEIGKSLQIKPMILEPVSGKNRWMQGLDRKKGINEQDGLLRSRAMTPAKNI